jgi:hypothetical protein
MKPFKSRRVIKMAFSMDLNENRLKCKTHPNVDIKKFI